MHPGPLSMGPSKQQFSTSRLAHPETVLQIILQNQNTRMSIIYFRSWSFTQRNGTRQVVRCVHMVCAYLFSFPLGWHGGHIVKARTCLSTFKDVACKKKHQFLELPGKMELPLSYCLANSNSTHRPPNKCCKIRWCFLFHNPISALILALAASFHGWQQGYLGSRTSRCFPLRYKKNWSAK